MNGIQYEQACARYLKHHGYHGIQMTPATGDQGIDIIAYKRRKKYGFQCKYYSSSVGNDAVQQAFAGKKYYDCDYAGVITNSVFTPSAIRLAEAADVILLEEITPALIYLPSFAIKASCFALACMGLSMIAGHLGDSSFILIGICMVLSALLTAFGERRYNVMMLACIFHALTLLTGGIRYLDTKTPSFTLTMTFAVIMAVYAGIRMIALVRIRTANYTETAQNEIRAEKEETLKNTGILFGSMLERDLHAHLHLISAYQSEDRISEFLYEADHDVSDELPVLEALLNHTADVECLPEGYQLNDEGDHRIRAIIVPRPENAA